MAMAVNNARYATAWPSDCACHPEGVAAWSAPKRAAGPVARNKDTSLCRGLVIGVSCSGWRLRIALGNGNEAGRPSEDSVKRCAPSASRPGRPLCRCEMGRHPGRGAPFVDEKWWRCRDLNPGAHLGRVFTTTSILASELSGNCLVG